MPMQQLPEIMTPEQAAEYLQLNKETIYRYIREGKLLASRLGRTYRIPKANLDALLWETRTRQDIKLREFSDAEIAAYDAADQLSGPARVIAEQLDQLKVHPAPTRR